jgi:hypothetical protein
MAPQGQVQNILALARQLIFDPRMSKWTIPLQLLGEVVLCGLIIWKVPCTSPQSSKNLLTQKSPNIPKKKRNNNTHPKKKLVLQAQEQRIRIYPPRESYP